MSKYAAVSSAQSGKQAAREPFHWAFLPVLLILLVVPLAVRLWVIGLDSDTMHLFGEGEYATTLFTQAKAIILWIASGAMAVFAALLCRKLFQKRDTYTLLYLIATGVFFLFSLLSALFSEYKSVAFFGVYNRAEGFLTLLCYLVAFLYTVYVYRGRNDIRYVVLAIGIVVVVNALLGLFQYVGSDPITSEIGLKLVVPSQYYDSIQSVDQLFEKGKIHGTFFHYNYVGSYTALVIPLLFVLAVYAQKLRDKIILGVCALLGLFVLYGSTSRGGLVGIAVATLFGIIVFARVFLRHWKPTLIVVASLAFVAVGLNMVTKGSIFERIPSLISDAFSVFNDTSNVNYLDKLPVRNVQNQNGAIEFTLQNGSLTVSSDTSQILTSEDGTPIGFALTFRDAAGNPVDYTPSFTETARTYVTSDPAYKNLSFRLYSQADDANSRISNFVLYVGRQETFSFSVSKVGELQLLSKSGKDAIDLDFPEVALFQGKEQLGSMRGYIWGRTIPLLSEHLLLGSGPDTFAFVFPQKDLLGTYYSYGTPNMVVDKPHNLYLQIWMNDGLPALLAFLVIVVLYAIDCLRLYALKRKYDWQQALGVALFLGVIGYLGAGFFNDSIVDVAPTFWILLGIGIAVNFRNRTALPAENLPVKPDTKH